MGCDGLGSDGIHIAYIAYLMKFEIFFFRQVAVVFLLVAAQLFRIPGTTLQVYI